MSTITLSPSFAPRPATASPLRFTRRGKSVLLLAFLGLLMLLMLVFGSLAVAARDGGTPAPVRVVQVQPGDTLYGIAGEVAEPGEVRDMVQQISELNALDGGSLEVGQRLAVPRG